MKTYTLSKQDLEYMQPVNANLQALNTAIQVYIINVVFPRIGLKKDAQARYDISKGEVYLLEESDKKPVTPPPPPAPATPPQQVKKVELKPKK